MDNNLAKIRHERSLKDFPNLKLEDGEYVEFAFMRAKICLLMILGGTALGLILILIAFLVVLMSQSMIDDMGRNFLFIILSALMAAAFLVGLVALRVYKGNRLYITNKHVIQFVMNSLVSSSINIIDLASVEDASFRQDSLLQKLFHYGTFRLSTVGDETTYTFKYSDISPAQLRTVTKLITEAKKEVKKKED
ncbi:PH domain-containing protein [Candidatus Saccharibacteria bacterium]|nr:PH domain-containing protein [Candidatus Saccharibacteria bacterium]